VAAWDQGDRSEVVADAKALAGAWPPEHPSAVLHSGLSKAATGDGPGALALFEGFRQRTLASDLATKKHNEKRVLSVNLYFMARAAARLGASAEAQQLVDLADRLHPGKRRVAQQDPIFR
jgi:hypothetical protein